MAIFEMRRIDPGNVHRGEISSLSAWMLLGMGLLVSSALPAAPAPFTFADTLALDHESNVAQSVVASSQGRYVAWIDGGDLRIAYEPQFKPLTLVAHGKDGPISKAYSSTDGRTLLYVRGQRQAGFGSIAARDTRELWQIDVEQKGPPRRVAAGAELPPAFNFAPGGEAFAFAEGNVLYESRRDASGAFQRRQLLQPDARHIAATRLSGIVYSPNGKRIAFVSERKARQSYVAIHDIATGETRYIEPGIYQDESPAWSPDGTELVFVRSPGNWTMQYRFSGERHGAPWSLVAANADSGGVRTVWKADHGRGSVASTFTPLWMRDGRILFNWERTGWKLLYAVPAKGGAATLLTPGEGEVSRPVVSPDEKTLVYEANIGDLARRHLWRMSSNGGSPIPLTSGTGVERHPQLTAGGFLLYREEYRQHGAPQMQIRDPKDLSQPLQLLSSDAERRLQTLWGQFQPVKVVSVRADDGITSYHIVTAPKTAPPPGGFPVIVNAHGGPTAQTRPGNSYAFAFGQYLASRGFLFVDMNYRGSTGFGLDYRLPEGRGAMGGSEVKDLAALAKYLKARRDVDPKRSGIMGESYGGHIVGLAMSQLPDDYAVGVSQFGVADWVIEMKKDQEAGGTSAPPPFIRLSERTRIEELAYDSSPSSRLDRWRGPTLFTIGDLDTSGHMESVIDLGYQLLDRGVTVEFYVEPSGGHSVFAYPQVFDFFERHLQMSLAYREPAR